ncbi:MAG: hypothetical protein MJZ21_01470 [archaeon]|nr:hypothetical protein [archaeon]
MSNKVKNPAVFLNEGPEVVGIIASVLENNGSIDTAARELATHGPVNSRVIFRKVVEDADLRIDADMENAIYRKLSELPEQCGPYSMAIRMALSAAKTSDRNERSRILKESSDIALNGLKEIGKSFSSSLNTPCMVIFGLGIMIPMILMSVIPMMSISGLFGSSKMDSRSMGFLTLVLIPSIVLIVVMGINGRNPLRCEQSKTSIVPAIVLFSAVPFFIVLEKWFPDVSTRICVSAIIACILSYISAQKGISDEGKRMKKAKILEKSIFEIGNRLISGEDFESAVSHTLSSRNECKDIGSSFANEVMVSRGDIENSILKIFGPISKVFCDTMLNVYAVSKKDPSDAGKLAMSLGRKNEDREAMRRNIRNELKNMTDTMFGTASVFAPLVLGLSISMLEPMKAISEGIETEGTSCILSIYLCELCAVISLLLSLIDGKCSLFEVVRRLTLMLPVSLTVFLVATNLSL